MSTNQTGQTTQTEPTGQTGQASQTESEHLAEVSARWIKKDCGFYYRQQRWRSERSKERDPRAVRSLLAHRIQKPLGRALDVACGPGRLHATLQEYAQSVYATDVSPEMLVAHPQLERGQVCLSSVEQLPFDDEQFELVLLCRLFHHFCDDTLRKRVLAELLRVSKRYVVLSFWDKQSMPGLRRHLNLRKKKWDKRHCVSRKTFEQLAQSQGARVVDYASSLRFASMQTFALLEKQASL